MSGSPTDPALQVHGWTVFAHPLFLAQLDTLNAQVEALQRKDPVGYVKKNATKRLAAIRQLAFEVIPQDPTRPEYRQGNTLGDWETLLIEAQAEGQRLQRLAPR
ncbi:MAG: type II toxin-antitoxin system YhaV family toxin [Arenimonas sp.]|nr:type II toxin-antitoxin system YhaV family toxin [Arenimonas sp.]